MSSINDSWEVFFRNCGLPKNVHRKYAQRFVKERIQPSMLKDIGKAELTDLGVETLGDQLCILRYVKSSNGILDEFRDANKQRNSASTAAAVVRPNNNDDVYMDSDFDDLEEDDEEEEQQKVKSIVVHRKATAHTSHRGRPRERAGEAALRAIASQSHAIRKKPAVMIHDVSSSSSRPMMVGKMRSDDISMKAMIVADDSARRGASQSSRRAVRLVGPVVGRRAVIDPPSRLIVASACQREPDFRVRLDVRPQARYDDVALFDDDAVEDVSTSRGRLVTAGGRGGSAEELVVAAERRRPVVVSNGRRLLASLAAKPATASRQRPVITLAGRRVSGSGAGRAGGSILNRISIVPK